MRQEAGPDRGGHIKFVAERRKGLISVVKAEDLEAAEPFPGDWEQTVVHELLHVHTNVFDTTEDSVEEVAEEQAVDALADALVSLNRGEHKDPPSVNDILPAAVQWWQQVMNLRDWRIRAEFVPRRHWHETKDVSGYCNPSVQQQNAVIHLIHPKEEDTWLSFASEGDTDLSLVHEMVHLHFHSIWGDDVEGLQEDLQERAVEMVAQALLNEARGAGAVDGDGDGAH